MPRATIRPPTTPTAMRYGWLTDAARRDPPAPPGVGDPLPQAARSRRRRLAARSSRSPGARRPDGARCPVRSAGHLPGRDDLRRERRSLPTGFEADAVASIVVEPGRARSLRSAWSICGVVTSNVPSGSGVSVAHAPEHVGGVAAVVHRQPLRDHLHLVAAGDDGGHRLAVRRVSGAIVACPGRAGRSSLRSARRRSTAAAAGRTRARRSRGPGRGWPPPQRRRARRGSAPAPARTAAGGAADGRRRRTRHGVGANAGAGAAGAGAGQLLGLLHGGADPLEQALGGLGLRAGRRPSPP